VLNRFADSLRAAMPQMIVLERFAIRFGQQNRSPTGGGV